MPLANDDHSVPHSVPPQWCEHAGNAYRKFTLLPGLLEIQLAKGLRVMGCLPTLWPDVDEADVRIDVGGMR